MSQDMEQPSPVYKVCFSQDTVRTQWIPIPSLASFACLPDTATSPFLDQQQTEIELSP